MKSVLRFIAVLVGFVVTCIALYHMTNVERLLSVLLFAAMGALHSVGSQADDLQRNLLSRIDRLESALQQLADNSLGHATREELDAFADEQRARRQAEKWFDPHRP